MRQRASNKGLSRFLKIAFEEVLRRVLRRSVLQSFLDLRREEGF